MSQPLTIEHFDETITALNAYLQKEFADVHRDVRELTERVSRLEYRMATYETRLDQHKERSGEKFRKIGEHLAIPELTV